MAADVNNAQLVIKFPSTPVCDDIAVATATDTTEREITVSLPSGASIVRAMLAVFLTAKNATANAQDIDISVSGRLSGGTWTTFITLLDHLGLPNIDRATTGDVLLADVSTLVNAEGTYGFKCTITLSSANAVRFKTQYILLITYKIS